MVAVLAAPARPVRASVARRSRQDGAIVHDVFGPAVLVPGDGLISPLRKPVPRPGPAGDAHASPGWWRWWRGSTCRGGPRRATIRPPRAAHIAPCRGPRLATVPAAAARRSASPGLAE